jgi:hypothetical protein
MVMLLKEDLLNVEEESDGESRVERGEKKSL